jgi:sodium transport system permease protein
MVLLLRSVIEGQYHQAWPFVAPVALMTLACCLLAIRWAEEQFNRESVLFRESERLELRRWLVHVVRDREDTPSFAQAMLCVAIILVVQFFVSVSMTAQAPEEITFAFLAKTLLVSQIACILAPVAIMTVMLTRRPAKTLLLERAPRATHLAAGAALAVLVHPLAVRFGEAIHKMYPFTDDVRRSSEAIEGALSQAPHWWMALAVMALLPAACEELAFRGFVLSGLRHVGHKWWAIALSAVAFGGVHMFLSQKIVATVVGLLIGYLAVQSGSLWPGMLFHAIHNSLQLAVQRWAGAVEADAKLPFSALLAGETPLLYHPATVAACALGVGAIMWSLRRAPYQLTREEQLEEARQRQNSPLVGA